MGNLPSPSTLPRSAQNCSPQRRRSRVGWEVHLGSYKSIPQVGNVVVLTPHLRFTCPGFWKNPNFHDRVSGRHYVVFWPVWTRGHRYYSWEPEQPVEVTFDYDIFYMDCVTAEELSSGVYHRISIKPEGTCYVRSHLKGPVQK